jgi:hypothetical protein
MHYQYIAVSLTSERHQRADRSNEACLAQHDELLLECCVALAGPARWRWLVCTYARIAALGATQGPETSRTRRGVAHAGAEHDSKVW